MNPVCNWKLLINLLRTFVEDLKPNRCFQSILNNHNQIAKKIIIPGIHEKRLMGKSNNKYQKQISFSVGERVIFCNRLPLIFGLPSSL